MRFIVLFWMLLFVGCQPSLAEKDTVVTDKTCGVAVQLAKTAIQMFQDGHDQYDVMSKMGQYNNDKNPEVYAGMIVAQLSVVDIQKNVRKGFKSPAILKVVAANCKATRGHEFTK